MPKIDTRDAHGECKNYNINNNLYNQSCQRYAQGIQNLKECAGYTQIVPKICRRYAKDMPNKCPRYVQHKNKICPRYAKHMDKICQK